MNLLRHAFLGAAMMLAAAPVGPAAAADAGSGVLAYHNGPERSGLYVAPGLDWARAGRLRFDAGFHPRFPGHLYAQPLYWLPSGAASGQLIVASESDVVTAIDAQSGATLWQRRLGRPVPRSALPCGNIDPLGITGTPVIDPATATLYLNAVVDLADGMHHRVFALSLADGSTVPGWPVDVAAAAPGFQALVQNQRGALALFDGRVYVPFGGHDGDCGDYHGWVVGIRRDNPADVVSWSTRARGGGIWSPGGIASDGNSLFVATGNTFGASTWSDGEAVIRLAPGLRHDERRQDFFTPRDWRRLDAADLDIGGVNPLPLDLPLAAGAVPMVLALGKDGNAYLMDRSDLGGVGGELARAAVSAAPIITAPAAYPAPNGVHVAFRAPGAQCRGGGAGLTALKIVAGPPPRIATAWCAALDGAGAAIATTTDGAAQPIVWITGAEGDGLLHGFRGDTGEALFAGGAMAGLRHFGTLLAAGNRLYVGADDRLYAFSY